MMTMNDISNPLLLAPIDAHALIFTSPSERSLREKYTPPNTYYTTLVYIYIYILSNRQSTRRRALMDADAAFAKLKASADTSRAQKLLQKLSSGSGGAESGKKAKVGAGAKRKYRSDASLDALLAPSASASGRGGGGGGGGGESAGTLLEAARDALGRGTATKVAPAEVRTFAGEEVTVPAATGATQAEKPTAPTTGLDSVLAALKPEAATLNTLDKSKADWQNYKVRVYVVLSSIVLFCMHI